MQLLLATVAAAVAITSVHGLRPMGLLCNHTSDCPLGSSCVAGGSTESIQTCVLDQVCGGNLPGNCPGFVEEGSLICTYVPQKPQDCTFGRCQRFENSFGIYKCLSVDRCDAALESSNFGKNKCSSGCNINGKSCNGRGNCQSYGPSTFKCICHQGWNGLKCENAVNSTCKVGVGHCGAFGYCLDGQCSCYDKYTGVQCEISPHDNSNHTSSPEFIPLNSTNNSNPIPFSSTTIPFTLVPDNQINKKNTTNQNSSLSNHNIPSSKRTLPATVTLLSSVAGGIIFFLILFGFYARHLRKKANKKNEEKNQFVHQLSKEGTFTPRENIQVL